MSYERECLVAREAARVAADILRAHYEGGTKTWEKKKGDPVTLADLEADTAIQKVLREAFPDDAILSEESVSKPSRLDNDRVWIVDPMDGTKEFTRKIPEFCASIALAVGGEPVVGAITNPASGVSVWASKGEGTFRDGERARVTDESELARASVIASRTEIDRGSFEEHESWFASVSAMGSIAWKLACVACGDADLNISFAPKNEWDVCAGDVLIREAGGVYCAFDGSLRVYNQADPLIETFMAAGARPLVEAFCQRETGRNA